MFPDRSLLPLYFAKGGNVSRQKFASIVFCERRKLLQTNLLPLYLKPFTNGWGILFNLEKNLLPEGAKFFP